MDENTFETMVANLAEMITITGEIAVCGRENELLLLNQLLMGACAEVLSDCLTIAGENHIDIVAEHLFTEILKNAKHIIKEEK